MRLTSFSDLTFRVLVYAAGHKNRLITIDELHDFYNTSRGHLMKVVNTLTREGLLTAVRGRSGGVQLAKEPQDIRLTDVLRITETDFAMVECMRPGCECVLVKGCKLINPIQAAVAAYLNVLSQYTLRDIMINESLFSTMIPSGSKTVSENQ